MVLQGDLFRISTKSFKAPLINYHHPLMLSSTINSSAEYKPTVNLNMPHIQGQIGGNPIIADVRETDELLEIDK